MSEISANLVKELREKTGAGMMECKAALKETQGNMDSAVEHLRKRGLAKAAKRSGRETGEGVVQSYIHAGGKIGVLVEVNCETDFVAKTDEFQNLVKNIAMHIAAANPRYLKAEEVPAAELDKEREIYRDQMRASGKPEKAIDGIVEGKIKKYFTEVCLLDQPFVREPDKSVNTLLQETIAKVGENITIRRYARFQLGAE